MHILQVGIIEVMLIQKIHGLAHWIIFTHQVKWFMVKMDQVVIGLVVQHYTVEVMFGFVIKKMKIVGVSALTDQLVKCCFKFFFIYYVLFKLSLHIRILRKFENFPKFLAELQLGCVLVCFFSVADTKPHQVINNN